jgi:hypothetical protein
VSERPPLLVEPESATSGPPDEPDVELADDNMLPPVLVPTSVSADAVSSPQAASNRAATSERRISQPP